MIQIDTDFIAMSGKQYEQWTGACSVLIEGHIRLATPPPSDICVYLWILFS